MENAFRTKLSRGTPLGTWLMSGAPATAEALGHVGFDFLVLDLEHVPVDAPQAIEHLRAIGNTPAAPIVRLPWNDLVWIKRMMDAGAQTIMVPFVQNASEAEQAAQAMRYPPQGRRGVAAVHRASHYGVDRTYLKTANDRAFLIVQLETPEAIANLPEIARVQGVDGLFIGPGDLSAAMGHLGDIAHQDVQTALANAAAASRNAGLPVGIVGPNPDMVKRFLDYGYSFAAVASDMGMLTSRAGDFLAALRGTAPAAGNAGPY
jgi:2-dehydro-3-deoxyglucarate aldolase/4-hydroxy-2-oxoheptanedioate aldolase